MRGCVVCMKSLLSNTANRQIMIAKVPTKAQKPCTALLLRLFSCHLPGARPRKVKHPTKARLVSKKWVVWLLLPSCLAAWLAGRLLGGSLPAAGGGGGARACTRIASVNYASDIGDVRARARHNCGTEATM